MSRDPADNFGFTLRGGMQTDPEKCRPLTVTQIRAGSACDREGTVKIGDRVLAMNGLNVTQCTLAEALSVLRHADTRVTMLIEYDVSVMGKKSIAVEWRVCVCVCVFKCMSI